MPCQISLYGFLLAQISLYGFLLAPLSTRSVASCWGGPAEGCVGVDGGWVLNIGFENILGLLLEALDPSQMCVCGGGGLSRGLCVGVGSKQRGG